MPSRFKRAHRTHALAQPAGEAYPRLGENEGRAARSDEKAVALYAQLCERVPDAARRAELLGVSPELDAAWQSGSALPALRARRKALERALRNLAQ
jgi:hypothetical protein